MCPEWTENYAAFLQDMGRRPSPEHSIERLDVNGHYEPKNCCWATVAEQALNRRATIRVMIGGHPVSLKVACREHGVDYSRAYYWVKRRRLSFPEAVIKMGCRTE